MRNNTKKLIVRYFFYILAILALHILQNTQSFLPQVFGVRAMPLIPMAVCLGMFERKYAGAVLGLFAGALWDSVSPVGDGFNALVLMIIAASCGLLINVLMRNHMLTALILVSASLLIYVGLYILFFVVSRGYDSVSYLFLRYYLPSCLYSVLFTPFFFLFVRMISRATALKEEF